MNAFRETKPEEFQISPFAKIGNDWMLVTAERVGIVNSMTASWGGLGVLWAKNVAYVVIRPQRYTKEFVDAAGTFSLSFFGRDARQMLNYMGSISGRAENKVEKASLTVVREDGIPYFDEASTVLLCRKMAAQRLDPACFLDPVIDAKFYPEKDYHTLYIAEVTKILMRV